MKLCVLDEKKTCNDCRECDRCDINPDKLCDNCCACIDMDQVLTKIEIADIVTTDVPEYLEAYFADEEEREEQEYED